MRDDPRQAAERYRLARAGREAGASTSAGPDPQRGSTATERAAYVETSIQQAIRRGDFDGLPGAGKPLEGLGETHDPDWWIRRKIAAEQLTGLGPPALALRVEHRDLDRRLDAITREEDVREILEDFNRRVIEARRQLLGGPPVVTPTRDVEAEIRAWRDRRAELTRDAAPDRSADDAPSPQRWWRRARSR